MTFFPFIESVMTYFKSVRKLQDYISFDMVLPSRWVSLFEKENISHLRGLKFDVEDLKLTQLSNGEENT